MMEIKKVDIGLSKIDKIYHIADVHIRNLKRHQEYRDVFKGAADFIKSDIGPNDIIFLGGDIVHAKTDMSPELVAEVGHFFKTFADIAPVILITGNHDCNLNNKSRLDALSPIINNLNHPNLFYLKDSGIYEIADKHFTVMSVFDKPKDFILAKDFIADYKIALHHGAVNSAYTDVGFQLINDHVDVPLFAGYDLVLLGDIHKMQYLNPEKTIAFPGSLIQQNHAESLQHGMLVWDTKTKESTFVEVPNKICYYTLFVHEGNVDLSSLSPVKDKEIRLRIKSTGTSPAQLKSIISDIKSKYNIIEVSIQKILPQLGKTYKERSDVGDVRDVEYQNSLIAKYLEDKYALDSVMIDGVRHINRTINSLLPKTETRRNISWIPKRFEFSNMFSYGEDNVIDFTNFAGVYGLFAPNASGKSSLLDAITYCIFDKCSKATKASSVMNVKADYFSCKFNFELDGIDYFIERHATKGRGGHVRVDIKFYTQDALGNVESLNGKERSETNDAIRKILGNYEDFILTTFSVQNNNSGFIDMQQRERKDLLAQFLDINIFEELSNLASAEIKEVAVLIKDLQKQDFATKIAEARNLLADLQKKNEAITETKIKLEVELESKREMKLKLTRDLVPVKYDVSDVEELEKLLAQYSELISKIREQKNLLELKISDIDKSISIVEAELSSYPEVSDCTDEILQLFEEEKKLLLTESKLKSNIDAHKGKMDKLKNLEYDENCQYCMNNIFVKDAIQTKNLIIYDESDLYKVQTELGRLDILKKKLNESKALFNKVNSLKSKLQSLNDEKTSVKGSINDMDSKSNKVQEKLLEAQIKLRDISAMEEQIQKNKELHAEIDVVESECQILSAQIKEYNNNLLNILGELGIATMSLQVSQDGIERLQNLEQQYKFYHYYLDSVSRDGVPYNLISETVPKIEYEINNILSQIVDFNIILETDGKNINCYIVYEEDSYWPVELTSGMEKFIASLAIRTALVNISSLPRPNFLAIDEGFGSLDQGNINNLYSLFDYLKSQFQFILIISHIESMRDIVDGLIDISKVSGSSKIYYT